MLQRSALRTMTCLVFSTGLLAGGCSSSAPFSKANDFDRMFISAAQTWDLDKNGSVSCDEWVQYVQQAFRENDVNADGALDQDEYGKLVRSDRLFEAANIAYYDTNSDGRASVEEMTGKQNVAFKLLDRNSDCQIDRTESVQVHGIDKGPAKSAAPDTTQTGTGGGRGGY
jgi:Ca2+-binding EF-hand superfamily protein